MPAISQTTVPPLTTTASSGIFIPVSQGRIITASLQKYELLKPAYLNLQKAHRELKLSNYQYKLSLSAKDSALTHAQTAISKLDTLYRDSQHKEVIWQKKAKRNQTKFLLSTILSILAAGYLATH